MSNGQRNPLILTGSIFLLTMKIRTQKKLSCSMLVSFDMLKCLKAKNQYRVHSVLTGGKF